MQFTTEKCSKGHLSHLQPKIATYQMEKRCLNSHDEPSLSKEEAEDFISRVLQIDLPTDHPPRLDWINQLILAFHRKLPFQVSFFLSV